MIFHVLSLPFRAGVLHWFLLFFDCFPNCGKPKNIEKPLVLIQYFALGTFRKRTKKIKKQCKNSSSFCIDFSSKILTFSGSKSAWIFGWFFHWKWPPKVVHFQWKNHPKNKTFSEPLKNRFFCFFGALRDSARWPYWFFFCVFRFLDENGRQRVSPRGVREEPPNHPKRSKNDPKTHLRRNLDFSSISVACGNGSAPGPMEVGLHVMVCNVFFLIRKGFGDLWRKWLDARSDSIEKTIV